MPQVTKTIEFDTWIDGLRDRAGRARILARVDRLANGNPGVVRPVGEKVSELVMNFGPGYRVYFVERQSGQVVVLLGGGDKSTQQQDINDAIALSKTV